MNTTEPEQRQRHHFFLENDMTKTIMIVDDSASMRQVVGIALKGAGYAVLEGRDGKDALSKLTGEKIHLIISDVNMPNMDGITFVKEVKLLPAYKFTPIIMLTTESDESKKREGQAAGARAWVVKPFKPEQLLAAVQKLCLP
jgi:two-component system chemotaxis response regulator CheY